MWVMPKMGAMIVPQARGPLRMEERDIPEPGRQEVRIRVHACGVCHSDSIIVEGHMPGLTYPRIPGHEVIGVIEAFGAEARGWEVGTRVGVGWSSGACGYCSHCYAPASPPSMRFEIVEPVRATWWRFMASADSATSAPNLPPDRGSEPSR